ncbi:four helix bundle protein [Capnocytophaga canis]|uniref:four helix bundle protein n=1 Tax=Capnocytophaga canis TaxID=1848903 RepID=UPI001F507C02|nr:four helix bundle protein [Capnocytophaga canis]
MMLSYRELDVWKNAMNLVDDVYILTKSFPREELFVLTSQMRRASISIPSNIAEGFDRKNTKEYLQFCVCGYTKIFVKIIKSVFFDF